MIEFDPNILTSLDFWKNNMAIALTGIIMSFVGPIGYQKWKTALIANGNMQNKYNAVLLFNRSLLLTAVVAFMVNAVCAGFADWATLGQVIAVVLASSMYAVNTMIKTWRNDDEKSRNVYVLSIVIFVLAPIFNI